MRKSISQLIARESYTPSWIGIFCNPFFLARREIYRSISQFADEVDGRMIDVGCGSGPYKFLFRHNGYVGLEYDTPIARAKKQADAYYTGTQIPFDNGSFEIVLCTQVLEHVFEPDKFLTELNRIAKQGAKLMLTVPFVWDEHEQPYDFARYSSFGLKALLARNGWHVEHFGKLNAGVSALCQLTNSVMYKHCQKLGPRFGLILASILSVPFNLIGLCILGERKNSTDFYLDNFVIAKKL